MQKSSQVIFLNITQHIKLSSILIQLSKYSENYAKSDLKWLIVEGGLLIDQELVELIDFEQL